MSDDIDDKIETAVFKLMETTDIPDIRVADVIKLAKVSLDVLQALRLGRRRREALRERASAEHAAHQQHGAQGTVWNLGA